jgi:threonine/homoserine/homoserine lactone efflux protein
LDISVWLAFVAASVALLLIPGPTVLLVLAHAIGHGRKLAIQTALGVGLGDLIAMSASLLGLGALVLASATLFTALKWAGALYLIWLGVRMIRGASEAALEISQSKRQVTPGSAFVSATVVTALNPKSIVFFIAFVPQFLDVSRPLLPQSAILVGTFVGLALLNALAYALAAGRMRDAIRKPRLISWAVRAGGGMLVVMGLATALVRRASV